jgi:hypothetical protein
MSQDVDIPVVRPHPVTGVVWPIPLIEDFFHPVFVAVNPESCWPFFGSVPGVALHL